MKANGKQTDLALVVLSDDIAKGAVGHELFAAQWLARDGRGVVLLQPRLDGMALIGVAIRIDDGIAQNLLRERAEEAVWNIHLLCVLLCVNLLGVH